MPSARPPLRVLTWNVFHGRALPVAGRPLLVEFASALATWEWDVALLQEVPPWWPPALAQATGASAHVTLTSRHEGLALRRALAARNPDLLGSWGGGSNAILARVTAGAHARALLALWPERRRVHGVRLGDGTWVANLHLTKDPKQRTLREAARALAWARARAGGAPVVLGGDFNLLQPPLDAPLVASHWVDHVAAEGRAPAGPARVLDAGDLSDHDPLGVTLA